MRTLKQNFIAVLAVLTMFMGMASFAQANTTVQSNVVSIAASMSVAQSFTVSASVGSLVFPSPNGSGQSTAPSFTVTTSWNVPDQPSHSDDLIVGLTTPLTAGSFNITAAQTFAAIDGGSATACTAPYLHGAANLTNVCAIRVGTIAAGGGQNEPGATGGIGSVTDSVVLSINTGGQIVTGNYAGTFYVTANLY